MIFGRVSLYFSNGLIMEWNVCCHVYESSLLLSGSFCLCFCTFFIVFFFFKDFIYLLSERGEGRKKERGRNINVWLPLICPQLGTWPTTQTCVLTGNQTRDPLVHEPALNPLSHTSQVINTVD